MPIDEGLNVILKQMWALDNKLMKNDPLEEKEISFYNEHLEIIKHYYVENYIHWKDKEKIKREV